MMDHPNIAKVARRLLREEGLLAGGTSGTAVVAALRVAREMGLDGPVVVLLADSWDRYFSRQWMSLS
jgi:cysteine synthase